MANGVDGWIWISENLDEIDLMARRCWCRWPPSRYDFDDFLQDAVAHIAIHFHFDPTRGSARNWLWQKVYTTLQKAHRREAIEDRYQSAPRDMSSSHCPNLVDRIDIDRVVEMATPKQREALYCIAASVSTREVRERFGVSYQAMQNRMRALKSGMPHLGSAPRQLVSNGGAS